MMAMMEEDQADVARPSSSKEVREKFKEIC